MNFKFPSPKVTTYAINETIKIGNYEIKLKNYRWGDGEIIHDVYPGYVLIEENGEEYPVEKERVGLAELSIKKIKEDDTQLDFTSVAFESGAWGNQFDLELFLHLNPCMQTPFLELKEGENQNVILPITMLDDNFSEQEWSKIDDRDFYIVLLYYPNKIQIKC